MLNFMKINLWIFLLVLVIQFNSLGAFRTLPQVSRKHTDNKSPRLKNSPMSALKQNLEIDGVLRKSEKMWITSSLAISYMTIISSVMTLSSTLLDIDADKSVLNPMNLGLSTIVSISTLFTAIGKLLMGPVTDKFGGAITLHFAMVAMIVSLLGCISSSFMSVFALWWTVLMFFFSCTWGALCKTIHASFPAEEWAQKIGTMAVSSRLGSTLATISYGALMAKNYRLFGLNTWKSIFLLAALMQSASVVLNFIIFSSSYQKSSTAAPVSTSDGTEEKGRKEGTEVPISAMLRRIAVLPRFWNMLAAKMCLMLTAQFISFIPLYLVTGWGYSNNEASSWSSVFALGSLLANSFGTKLYSGLGNQAKAAAIAASNLLCVLASGLLLFHMYTPCISPAVCLLLLLIWGAAWSLPFYIPSGIMAFELGCSSHAATVTNIFDIMGTAIAAGFSIPVIQYGKLGQWKIIFGAITAANALSMISMYFAMSNTNEQLKKEKHE